MLLGPTITGINVRLLPRGGFSDVPVAIAGIVFYDFAIHDWTLRENGELSIKPPDWHVKVPCAKCGVLIENIYIHCTACGTARPRDPTVDIHHNPDFFKPVCVVTNTEFEHHLTEQTSIAYRTKQLDPDSGQYLRVDRGSGPFVPIRVTRIDVVLTKDSPNGASACCSIHFNNTLRIDDVELFDDGKRFRMPARSLGHPCSNRHCRAKNHYNAIFCSKCGQGVTPASPLTDKRGRNIEYHSLAFPIRTSCRSEIQTELLAAYQVKVKQSQISPRPTGPIDWTTGTAWAPG